MARQAGRQAIVSHSRATSNNLQQKPRRTESKEEREREMERDKLKVSVKKPKINEHEKLKSL